MKNLKPYIFIFCPLFVTNPVNAVEVIPEKELAEHVGSSGSIRAGQIQQVISKNGLSNQNNEEKELVEKNNKIIQEKNLDGTAMSEFFNQQKKIDEKVIAPPSTSQFLQSTRFVIQDVENIRVTYPDAINIELKH